MSAAKQLLPPDQRKAFNQSSQKLLEDAIDQLEYSEAFLEWWVRELTEAIADRDWDRAQYLSQQCKEELPELMQDCAI